MILKERDQRSPQDALERAGQRAEQQMAFYLARAFGPSESTVLVLHDLRLPAGAVSGIEGDAVQIDHLVLHRHGMVIIESKSVTSRVRVNAQGEWCRWWDGRWRGFASPVQQAKLQADALRALLQQSRDKLRNRFLLGLLPGGFTHCPIEVLVAFSDDAVVETDRGAKRPPEVLKADAVAERVRSIVQRHRSAASLVNVALGRSPSGSGDWSMTAEEMARVSSFLLASHTPRASAPSVPKTSPPPDPVAARVAPVTAPAASPEPSVAPGLARCKHCGAEQVKDGQARWGKRAYYTVCGVCGKGTDLDVTCRGCGALARIRKDGPQFWRECGGGGREGCGRKDLAFVNRLEEGG